MGPLSQEKSLTFNVIIIFIIINLSFIIEIFIVQKQQYFFTVQGNFKGPQRLGPLGPGLVGLAVNPPLPGLGLDPAEISASISHLCRD